MVHGTQALGVDGIGGDAVLGVHHVVRPGVDGSTQHGDGTAHLGVQVFLRLVRQRRDDRAHPRVERPEEGRVARAPEAVHGDLLPQVGEGLGQRERVDDAAPWSGGVGQQGDAHPVPLHPHVSLRLRHRLALACKA